MRTLALTLALLAAPAFAHDYAVGDISIAHPVSYPSVGMTGAGYMNVTNTGETPDRLISVSADFPRVELHLSGMNADGMMTMARQDHVDIPAGETVRLAPGGLHVMFMGVEGGLSLGQEIPATLTFEKAGSVDIVFTVEDRPEAGMDHGEMGSDK